MSTAGSTVTSPGGGAGGLVVPFDEFKKTSIENMSQIYGGRDKLEAILVERFKLEEGDDASVNRVLNDIVVEDWENQHPLIKALFQDAADRLNADHARRQGAQVRGSRNNGASGGSSGNAASEKVGKAGRIDSAKNKNGKGRRKTVCLQGTQDAGVDSDGAPATVAAENDAGEDAGKNASTNEHTGQTPVTPSIVCEGRQTVAQPSASPANTSDRQAQAKKKLLRQQKKRAAKLTVDEAMDKNTCHTGLLDDGTMHSPASKVPGTGDKLPRERSSPAASAAASKLPSAVADRDTVAGVAGPQLPSAAADAETLACDGTRLMWAPSTAAAGTCGGERTPRVRGCTRRIPRDVGICPADGPTTATIDEQDMEKGEGLQSKGQADSGQTAKQRVDRAEPITRSPATVREWHAGVELDPACSRCAAASVTSEFPKMSPAVGVVPPAEAKAVADGAASFDASSVVVGGGGGGDADTTGGQASSDAGLPGCLPDTAKHGAAESKTAESTDDSGRNKMCSGSTQSVANSMDKGKAALVEKAKSFERDRNEEGGDEEESASKIPERDCATAVGRPSGSSKDEAGGRKVIDKEAVRPRSRGRPRKITTPDKDTGSTEEVKGNKSQQEGIVRLRDRLRVEQETPVQARPRGRPRKINVAARLSVAPKTSVGATVDGIDESDRAEDEKSGRKSRDGQGEPSARAGEQDSSSPCMTLPNSLIATLSSASREERKRKRIVLREFAIAARLGSIPGGGDGTRNGGKGAQEESNPGTAKECEEKGQHSRDAKRVPDPRNKQVFNTSGNTSAKSSDERLVCPAAEAGVGQHEPAAPSRGQEAAKKAAKNIASGRGGCSTQQHDLGHEEDDCIQRTAFFGLSRQKDTAIEVLWDVEVLIGRKIEEKQEWFAASADLTRPSGADEEARAKWSIEYAKRAGSTPKKKSLIVFLSKDKLRDDLQSAGEEPMLWRKKEGGHAPAAYFSSIPTDTVRAKLSRVRPAGSEVRCRPPVILVERSQRNSA